MTSPAQSSVPLASRINDFFQHPTERERIVFEQVRRTLSLPTILRRRAAARALSADAPFTIDRARGFKVFPPGAFPEATELAARTHGLGAQVDLNRPGLSKQARSGLVPLLDVSVVDLASPYLRLALRPDVIAAVSSYLGIVPVIAHLQVYYSAAGPDEARSSQLFHCDADVTSQVKIFVLSSEVTRSNGPLTLLDAQTSRIAASGSTITSAERSRTSACRRWSPRPITIRSSARRAPSASSTRPSVFISAAAWSRAWLPAWSR